MRTLSPAEVELLVSSRRAVMATVRADGRPRLVPLVYAARHADGSLTLYSALDEKPKSVRDPRDLGRVRDIRERPRVALLIDRWSEDWDELAWLRLDGEATVLEPGGALDSEHSQAIQLLRERYAQYAEHALERAPLIRIAVDGVVGWSAAR